jgi:bifunctional UDP-N-acetylglucosamine pyrophosphorylase/glucosamine-1-phosphate N-acetyltransferase
VIAKASRHQKTVEALVWESDEDVMGINSLWELAQAEQIARTRRMRAWMEKGVRFLDPATTYVDGAASLESGVVIEPGVHLRGKTIVRKNAHLKAGTVVEDSEIGEGAKIGPYAHLRPGSRVGRDAKIGNFVELKKTSIGDRTSVAHLSYVGDATVGADVNIGCGFITCNFDGRVRKGERKHRTVIEDGAFIGSDCQVVAPITIGKGAYVASGSTITENVETEALAIARSRQTNKPGYAGRLRDRD